jgi:hypothetical protein
VSFAAAGGVAAAADGEGATGAADGGVVGVGVGVPAGDGAVAEAAAVEDMDGGSRITVGAEDGEAEGEAAATIPASVGASTGMGRLAMAGKAVARGFPATGTPSVPEAACDGLPPEVPVGVVEAVDRVPDTPGVGFDPPEASCAEDSLPKKGSSVAWLAVPTASKTARAPTATAIR